MEKNESCPECGCGRLSPATVAVTAEMRAFDRSGLPTKFAMPTYPLSFDIDGWHCSNCDYEKPDEDALGKYLARETEKIFRKAIAEIN